MIILKIESETMEQDKKRIRFWGWTIPQCIFIILAALVICAIIDNRYSLGWFKSSSAENQNNYTQQALVIQPDRIEVTAKQYYADYNANEILADEKYKDKPLRITGRVKSISKGIGEDSYVLMPVADFADVRCDLANKSEGFNIKKGERVIFDGVGNGMVMGDPLLRNCIVFVRR